MGARSVKLRQDIIAALQLRGPLNTLDLAETTGHPVDDIGRMCYYMVVQGILTKEAVAHPTNGGQLVNKWTLNTDEKGDIKIVPKKVKPAEVSQLTICLHTSERKEIRLTINDARYLYQQLSTLFGK